MEEVNASRKRIDWLVSQLQIIGGAETMIRECAPRLKSAGWDLRIITLVSGGELVDELRRYQIPVIELGLSPKSKITALIKLLDLWKAARPDLVHTHLYHAGLIGRLTGRLAGISPIIVHQHGPEFDRSKLRTLLDRWSARWVTRYVATCEAVAEILRKRERIPSKQIQVIYNGVEPIIQPDPHMPVEFKKGAGQLTLIYSGRLSPEKGHLTLIEALTLVKRAGFDFQLFLLGDGPSRDVILGQARQSGLEGSITCLGMRRDVRLWLPYCDLFVLPSDWEGASLSVLEAMAAGLPVVATASGGTPEIVQDGITGKLVPPRNPAALSEALIQIMNSSELRKRLGEAGQLRVISHFHIDQTIERISALYCRLLERNESRK